MNKIYSAVIDRVRTLDFEQLYPGFHSYNFALYNDDFVLINDEMMTWNESFIGNTSINYKGEFLAIWNMQNTVENMDVFTSKIVHEMFHAFQYEKGETRFPNEFVGLDYQYDIKNINLKINETMALINSIQNDSLNDFYSFLTIRKERLSLYKSALCYESKIEVVEGTARYIELKVLKELNEKLYPKTLSRMFDMLSDPKNYIPIRNVSYDIGALILIACHKFEQSIDYSIPAVKTYLEDTLDKIISFKFVNEIKEFDLSFINEYHQNNQESIQSVLNTYLDRHVYDKVLGFDPMNTVKVEPYLYCTHFISVLKNGETKNIFGKSVVKIMCDYIEVYTTF